MKIWNVPDWIDEQFFLDMATLEVVGHFSYSFTLFNIIDVDTDILDLKYNILDFRLWFCNEEEVHLNLIWKVMNYLFLSK